MSTTEDEQDSGFGMSSEARYNNNLKILRKRDPTILSIFDQFAHVAVYFHDGQHWTRSGYEGSMFLFERNAYPPYGLFVLNRSGLTDYIQLIYPEDDFKPMSAEVTAVRTYPEFLTRRLARLRAIHGSLPQDPFSSVYLIPNISELTQDDKGTSKVTGLWTVPNPKRDSLPSVLERLQSYLRQNLPYPQEFRYGPGKPPPSHRLRGVPKKKNNHHSDPSDTNLSYASQSESEVEIDSKPQSNAELDRLFAKIDRPASSHECRSQIHPSTSESSIHSLFMSALGTNPQPTQHNAVSAPSSRPTTGLALLDSIFASAEVTGPPITSSVSRPSSVTQSTSTIYSPQPSAGVSDPQILNQDVISKLLGFPTVRSASAASSATTYSSGEGSHPSSREGDNEDDGAESDAMSHSVASLDRRPRTDMRAATNGATSASASLLSSLGLGIPTPHGQGKVNGDVTPRPPLNGSASSRLHPVPMESISSVSTVRGSAQPTSSNGKPRANRALVPFEPNSELWPYSKGLADDHTSTDDETASDIVELDFAETSVLSDPDALEKVLRGKKSATRLNGTGYASGGNEMGKGKKGKRNKKQRDAKERELIEKSWDVVPPAQVAVEQPVVTYTLPPGPPASPSPPLSPEPEIVSRSQRSQNSVLELKTPTMSAKAHLSNVGLNGHGTTNGSYKQNRKQTNGNVLEKEVIKDCLVSSIRHRRGESAVQGLDKNQFVQEVLSLIYHDTSFVDSLWQEYTAYSQ